MSEKSQSQLELIEPGYTYPRDSQVRISIAISLKRIADALEKITNADFMGDVRYIIRDEYLKRK